MTMRTASLVAIAALSLVSACGGSDSASIPPTSPAVAAASTANGSSGTGTTTPAPVTVTGTVSAMTGACPAIAFKVEAKRVKTDGTTKYGDKACADVKVGVKVGAVGIAQADGSILAKEVRVIPPPPPPPVTVTGTVSAVTGACPAIAFTVEAKRVKTDGTTKYGGKACADVKVGVKVGAVGIAQADGSILAKEVRVIPPVVAPTPAISGAIATVSGTCPAITITVGAKVAVTSATTAFSGKGCGDLKAGMSVDIFGTLASGATTLTAVRVVAK